VSRRRVGRAVEEAENASGDGTIARRFTQAASVSAQLFPHLSRRSAAGGIVVKKDDLIYCNLRDCEVAGRSWSKARTSWPRDPKEQR
jgi:hypothetical protein